jgi:hypothetical protein
MNTIAQRLPTLSMTHFRLLKKAALFIALAILCGFCSATARASNKGGAAVKGGRAPGRRGPISRGAFAGLQKGKARGRVARHWKRVKVHGKYVLVPDGPAANPFGDFMNAVVAGVAQGVAEEMAAEQMAEGMDDSGDMEIPDGDPGWVAFARAHHLRHGPHGYIWPRGKGALPPRFAARAAAFRSAQMRVGGGGRGGGRSRK